MAARRLAPEADLAQVPAVTITISGSIRRTRTGWQLPMTAASVSASIAAAPGKGFNFQTASSITLRLTIKFLTTFMETVRMVLPIAVQAVPEGAAVGAAASFRAAPGSTLPE